MKEGLPIREIPGDGMFRSGGRNTGMERDEKTNRGFEKMIDRCLRVTRGDAIMLYALSKVNYTVRIHYRLDQQVDPVLMRTALDKTAKRYPYFCVSLKKNEKEYYYEENQAPVPLIHTNQRVKLGSEETNGHIWAVSYDGDELFIDFYHGRADGAGLYPMAATLLYYYFSEQYGPMDSTGIRTLDDPITEKEIHDPVDDLHVVDLSKIKVPPLPKALDLMETSGFQRTGDSGRILKLMIPESSFLPFTRVNDASPGIMICALMARAIERVHPKHDDPLVNSYVVNARPMLHAPESFHNCTNRVILHFDNRIRRMPLDRQCTAYRGKTILQSDEDMIRIKMSVSASVAQRILNTPDLEEKVQIAAGTARKTFNTSTFMVSYVGKWKQEQIGKHIKEFWTETPAGRFPLIEIAAVNGNIFLSLLQGFEEKLYYQALLEELKANDIAFTECGVSPIRIAEIVM